MINYIKRMLTFKKEIEQAPPKPNCVLLKEGKPSPHYVKPTGKVFQKEAHKAWGDSIYFFKDFSARKIYGFLPEKISVGDELRIKGSNGNMCFLVDNVSYSNNPKDMFFATICDKGYENENDESLTFFG